MTGKIVISGCGHRFQLTAPEEKITEVMTKVLLYVAPMVNELNKPEPIEQVTLTCVIEPEPELIDIDIRINQDPTPDKPVPLEKQVNNVPTPYEPYKLNIDNFNSPGIIKANADVQIHKANNDKTSASQSGRTINDNDDKVIIKPLSKYLEEDHREEDNKRARRRDSSSFIMQNGRAMTGFFYIRCPKCGRDKSFFTKEGIHSNFQCENCYTETTLEESDLTPLNVKCECGKNIRYRCNLTEQITDIDCFGCGSLITVDYNSKEMTYVTVNAQYNKH